MSEQDRSHDATSSPAGEPEAVVVGIDGSPPSRNALNWAIQEARSLGKPIRLVGATPFPASPQRPSTSPTSPSTTPRSARR